MTVKRIPKVSKRRLTVFAPLSLLAIIYALYTVGYYGYNLLSLKNEEIQLKEKLFSLQEQEQNLKIEIQKLKDPDYLARYAREKYLYSKDGEYIIKMEDFIKEGPKDESVDAIYDYLIYICGFIAVIIVFYLIKKGKKK